MDSFAQIIKWHYETLPSATKKALDFLSQEKWIKKSDWYLAGGTALALLTGNRKSVDLDFFSSQKDIDSNQLLRHFLKNNNWITTINKTNTIYGELFGAKISFIAYPFFVPKEKPAVYGMVNVLQPIDIAVMKVVTISQRGRKRDFYDLYWCANNLDSLLNIVSRIKKQYPFVAHDYHHILKSLVYFNDAENDPEPIIFFNTNWKKVKKFFIDEIAQISKKLMQY